MSSPIHARVVPSQWLGVCTVLASLVVWGCRSHSEVKFEPTADFQPYGTQIEYADACVEPVSFVEQAPPHTIREPSPDDYWDMTLQEAIRIALQNSDVLRDLGARVVIAPQTAITVYDPALQQSSPLNGEEAALSAFDAQFASTLFFSRDDRSFNNIFFGGGAPSIHQNIGDMETVISKTSATGTSMGVRNITTRTSNNSPVNQFPSAYDTLFQAEVRHPLLQGGGLEFNRIAGPNGQPGRYNGILIARINTDLALADFEQAVRNYLEDVQQTYWQLYFSYRNFEARIAARDSAFVAWETAKTQFDVGAEDILAESLTREQFYRFQSQVANALSGLDTDTALTGAEPGIYATERRLRYLLGIEINDGRLIRPIDEPLQAEMIFDWSESNSEALSRRVELRRQNWSIKQRELELIAARNLILMRLDLVGAYRWRGFGDELFGENHRPNGSAFSDLWQGDLTGWNMGLELSAPIGNRIGHAAVRNAELLLARERAVLREQERAISREISNAFGELDRAYHLARVNYNRVVAARQRYEGEVDRYELGEGELPFVFEAQSAAADAESEYFRALTDYNLAIAKIHFAKGTFLDYVGVHLSEGPWSPAAYRSAAQEARRFGPRKLNYCYNRPYVVTDGEYRQNVLPRAESEVVPLPPTTDEEAQPEYESIPPEPASGPLSDPFEDVPAGTR